MGKSHPYFSFSLCFIIVFCSPYGSLEPIWWKLSQGRQENVFYLKPVRLWGGRWCFLLMLSTAWLLPSDCSHIWEGARIPDVIMCFKQVHRTPHWPHSIVFLFWSWGGCFLLFFIISVSLLGRLLCRDGCVLKNLEDTSSSHFCSSTPALCSWLEGGSRAKIKWLASKMELPQKWVLRTK